MVNYSFGFVTLGRNEINMENLINDTTKYIKEFSKEEYNSHNLYHSLKVYKLDKKSQEKKVVLKKII